MLNYFEGDYNRLGNGLLSTDVTSPQGNTHVRTYGGRKTGMNLYNGNIQGIVSYTAFDQVGQAQAQTPSVQGIGYNYDQLNRLLDNVTVLKQTSEQTSNRIWNNVARDKSPLHEELNYDANGNIRNLKRFKNKLNSLRQSKKHYQKPLQIYLKQQLHEYEKPFFVGRNQQIIVTVGHQKIAPAICYESLQMDHSEIAKFLGADIYLASVAKSQNGLDKALLHYPEVAVKYNMPVLMANCVGFCDNFVSVGSSAIWNTKALSEVNLMIQMREF